MNSIIAGAAFSPGPAHSPPSTARSSSSIAWQLRGTGRRRIRRAGSVPAAPGQLHIEDHRLFVALRRRYLARTPRSSARRQKAPHRCRVPARHATRRRRAIRLTVRPCDGRRLSSTQSRLPDPHGRRARPLPLRRSAPQQSRQRSLRLPDRNLATALVLGVLRWQIQLDHQLHLCSSAPTPNSTPRF